MASNQIPPEVEQLLEGIKKNTLLSSTRIPDIDDHIISELDSYIHKLGSYDVAQLLSLGIMLGHYDKFNELSSKYDFHPKRQKQHRLPRIEGFQGLEPGDRIITDGNLE